MEKIFVDTGDALRTLCARLEQARWLAIDTEFMREKSYYPVFCLLQVADDRLAACIDPLAIEDLSPLRQLLFDERITKVFHAGRQDLEILYLLWGDVPSPVFDTQLAAALFGLGDQVGYGALVEQILKKRLTKGHARTDWSRRPLDEAQVRYAFDDVIYLGQLYEDLSTRLARKNRLHWLDADFRELVDPRTYETDAKSAWVRVKGNQYLKGAELAILQEIAEWRELEAMKSDRPKRWILKDEVMIDLARRRPGDLEALSRIRGLEPGVVKRRGERLLELVQHGLQRPEASWPRSRVSAPRLSPRQEAMADLLMCALRLIGERNEITASALGTRRELERLVSGDDSVPLLHGWRGEIAGETLVAVLEGRITPRVVDGGLTLAPAG